MSCSSGNHLGPCTSIGQVQPDGEGGVLELVNCACGSTLCLPAKADNPRFQDALRSLANDYAKSLHAGSTIEDGADELWIAPFRLYIPGILAKRGLWLHRYAGGWRVCAVIEALPRMRISA